jgi:error-prone DNA polymerase
MIRDQGLVSGDRGSAGIERFPAAPAYIELHCHSNFSLLDGASHPEELVAQAAVLGMPALALTDHDAVYAAPRFIRAAQEQGIRPILGAELTLAASTQNEAVPFSERHLTLLVENEAGWHNLCYLISRARYTASLMPGGKGKAVLPAAELIGCTGGLIALSGCRQGEIATALRRGDRPAALAAARHYRELFGRDNFYIELQRHFLPGEERLVAGLAALASYLQLGCVATNNVHYASRDRHRLQDVLVCIRHLTTLDEAAGPAAAYPRLCRLNSEYYLKSTGAMAGLFADLPEAIANTGRLADRCRFDLNYGLQDLPHFPTPHGMSSAAYLRRLCEEAIPQRYADSPATVRQQMAHELAVIEQAGLSNYFLIVWDIVRFARQAGILCQGRGSAANSLVAYLLHISPIDPLAHDLVFERFLSSERQVTPDIDIDFDAQRREEVIQYIYQRYGEAHTAMACTFVTFQWRSAIRDVGKVLGLAPEVVAGVGEWGSGSGERGSGSGDQGSGIREWGSGIREWGSEARSQGAGIRDQGLVSDPSPPIPDPPSPIPDPSPPIPDPPSPIPDPPPPIPDPPPPIPDPSSLLLHLARQLENFPRHLGIHAGGMIITSRPLMGRVPTEPATMPGRVVSQWDKDALEDVGLVKIDILGLRMLSAIADTLALIAPLSPAPPLPSSLSPPLPLSPSPLLPPSPAPPLPLAFTDPAVYEMITRADTLGVFQVESRAQAQMLPRLRPCRFADLIVAISLIRPGPIQGNMVHPYLRRRLGLEPVSYAHPLLEPALAETLGVILFQEQVLKVAHDLAGFTAGQGEQLRRALGAKQAEAEIGRFRAAFLAGAVAKGVPEATAALVFDQLKAFGGYSFAKSHAAAFAVLVYQSAWLKYYHLAAFYTALLNNQPMGFWNAAVLVNEARRQGVTALPVDIHQSGVRCLIEDGAIRLGLNYVKGVSQAEAARIVAIRAQAPFSSLADFWQRVQPGRRAAEQLILAGAMDGWGAPRRQLLWELGNLRLSGGVMGPAFAAEVVVLPALTAVEALLAEQAAVGLSTGEHIMAFYRSWLAERGILGSRQLAGHADGQLARVAGLLVVHQAPPTAKGHHFLTLEDGDGLINVIVRPQVYSRYEQIVRAAPLLVVAGEVQRRDGVVNMLARQITAVPAL